jgi:hypothetical protein
MLSDKARMLHFTQAGLKAQMLEIAPDESLEVPPSRRYHTIVDEDRDLDSNMRQLDEGTRARNRALQGKIDEVWSHTNGWEAKLRTEAKEAGQTIRKMQVDYQTHCNAFHEAFMSEIAVAFDSIDNDLYPLQIQRTEEIDKGIDHYYKAVVPEAIELQTGIVARKLKKQYEAFSIEQQKEKKREIKFVNNASLHIQITAQKFTDEKALSTACFYTLEDDVVESERRAARMSARRWNNAVTSISEGRKIIQDERSMREVEDVDCLDTVIETQQLLQTLVLEHFGANPNDDPIPKRGPKLQRRLDQAAINASRRQSIRTSQEGEGKEWKEADEDERVGEEKEKDGEI